MNSFACFRSGDTSASTTVANRIRGSFRFLTMSLNSRWSNSRTLLTRCDEPIAQRLPFLDRSIEYLHPALVFDKTDRFGNHLVGMIHFIADDG